MKLNPYAQQVTNSTIKSSSSASNNQYLIPVDSTSEEFAKIAHRTINDTGRKSKIHRSLIFSNMDATFKFYITSGNNHHLVERLMKKREKFSVTSEGSVRSI